MFKIGQLVKYDGTGVPVMARVVGYDHNRVRIMVLPAGLFLKVPAGDISIPGEDEAAHQREVSRDSWRYIEGGISNGMGGTAKRPAPNPDYVGVSTDEGRH